MAGFEGANQWHQLGFVFIVLATILDFGLWNRSSFQFGPGGPSATGTDYEDEFDATQAFHAMAFLCVLAALAISIMMIFGGKDAKPVKIAMVVVTFVAVFFLLVGICMWGSHRRKFGITDHNGDNALVMGCFCLFCLIAAAVFFLLELLGK